MNLPVYLISILDGFTHFGNVCGFYVFIGIMIASGFFVYANSSEVPKEESESAAKISRVVFISVIIAGAFTIASLFIPTKASIREAYLMYEGAKIVNAENGEKAIKAFEKKIDKLLKVLELDIGGNNTVYLGKGEYDNGDLGEIFIDLHKEGSTMRSIMNCFAIAVSLGLQYGVPLKTYVDFFKCVKFEPNGTVRGHDNIKRASSIVSLVFRVLGIDYLDPGGFRDEEE